MVKTVVFVHLLQTTRKLAKFYEAVASNSSPAWVQDRLPQGRDSERDHCGHSGFFCCKILERKSGGEKGTEHGGLAEQKRHTSGTRQAWISVIKVI